MEKLVPHHYDMSDVQATVEYDCRYEPGSDREQHSDVEGHTNSVHNLVATKMV